jgi:tail lysozyme
VADTIREFLVGLGFSVNESQQRNFVGALEGATLRAKLLGDAIEAMARTVVNKVGEVATQFEQLFYQSSRVGASASSIRAFEYAVSQLGGTLEGANSSLEDFAKFLRETPGATATVARLLKIPLEDAKDSAKFLLEANERLSHLSPALQARYRETFHLGDYNTSHALQNPAAPGLYGGQLERDAASGITGDAMKRATEFEQAWRGVWARIGTMAEGGESKLLTALTNPMQKFSEWLDKNSPQINDAISRMATSVGSLTMAWVDDLSKVHWDNIAAEFDTVAKSISSFVGELSGLINGLLALKPYLEWLKPTPVHGSVITEPIPGLKIGSGNPSSLGGVGKWWGEHAPSWLGGNTGGVTQNGVPVSDSNPLAVNVVRADAANNGGDGGGGFFGGIGSAISRMFGGGSGGGAGNSGPHGGSRGIGGWWTPDRMSHAVDRLMKEAGLTREGAAGLVARWSGVEASGGPTSRNPNGAFGIGQWLDRGPAALRWMKENGLNPQDFDAQLSWAAHELNSSEGRAAAVLRSAHTGREGARGASMYERAEGYNAATGTDNYTTSTPAERVLGILDKAKSAPTPAGVAMLHPPPLAWDTASPVWDQFNRSLPVGPVSTDNSSKNVTSTVTNNITVSGTDPQSTAAMVGLHLDRTSNDISRNLQGAFQ